MNKTTWKFATLFSVAFMILATGCTTTRTTDTSRTGLEQLLISNAVDQTLGKISIPPVQGRKVFLDPQYLDSVDKGYVVGSVRQKLLNHGAMLVDAKEGSDVTIELRSGGIGTDNVSSFVGMPSLSLPGPIPFELPEVRLYEKNSQYGTAKIGLVAFETGSGAMIFDSGRSLARADDSRWSVLGIGPFQSGSVREEVNHATEGTDFTARVANTVDPFKKKR